MKNLHNLPLSALAAALGSVCIAIVANAADTQLSPTVVTATRQESRVSDLLGDVTVINREAIEQIGGASIIDLLAQQPGIQMFQNGGPGTNAQLFIRGSRTDQVKVLVDGMPINSIDVSGSPLRFIPLADVERIEILRGPASALYGADAIGGVIQIFTRKGQRGLQGEAYAGFGSFGTQKLAAGVSAGDERWRFALSGSDFRSDGISAVRNARRIDADHDAAREMGVNGSLSFTPVAGHELSVQWMSNHGQTFFDSTTGSGTFNSRVDFANETWNLASRNTLTDMWTSTLRYGESVDDQASYTSTTPSLISTRSSQAGWQNDITLPLGTGLILIERTDQHVGPRSRFSLGRVDTSNDAIVLGWNAVLNAHHWQLSSRHDDHSVFGDRNTWSAGYGYQIDSAWRINASAGTSFKAPTLYQLYATISGALVANPALRPEEGRNKELALVWTQGLQTASLTWYRNDVTDLIDFKSGANQYQNISKAKLEGWTLAWSGRVDVWNFGSSLDLLEARNETTHKLLERRAKEKLTFTADRDWGAWNTGVELQAVGRRYSGTTANSEALPMGGYAVLNLTARYPLGHDLALELRGNNLTDKQYTTARTSSGLYDYNTPGASYFVGLRYVMK